MKDKSVKWMSIPYFPVSFKYFVLMTVMFIVGISGTGMSKVEALALSLVVYSIGLLLDQAEIIMNMGKALLKHSDS